MNGKIGLAVALLLASGATGALAQETSLSPRYSACLARAHGNTVQEGICAQSEMASQDARLNKAYQQVMRQLASQPAKKVRLRDQQRSWLKERDYTCKVDGQTVDEVCLVNKTAGRADYLEGLVHF